MIFHLERPRIDKRSLLDSVVSRSDGLTGGTVWTSLTSGRDYTIRQDGDYLYMDWVSIPTQIKEAAGFTRSELKKGSDGKWREQAHARLPLHIHQKFGRICADCN